MNLPLQTNEETRVLFIRSSRAILDDIIFYAIISIISI